MKISNVNKLSVLTFCSLFLLINGSYAANNNPKKASKDNSYKSLTKDFSHPLLFPEIVMGKDNVSLMAQKTTLKVNGANINVLGYHNGILGPTIVAERGEQINVNLKNNLDEETNIHWHGLIVPAIMDGHPENVVKAHQSFDYSFKIDQRSGMYWYHPHPHNKTAKQAYLGLAGVFLVRDKEEKKLNLPSGSLEVPLVIQDKRLDGKNLTYNPNSKDVMTGFMGKYIMVNGITSPFLNVSTQYYRLRVLNGSNAKVYNLSFSNKAVFNVIGSDGGLLVSPKKVNSLMLGPGERADILVDFSNYNKGTEIYLQSNIFSGGNNQGKTAFKIIKFNVSTKKNNSFKLPAVLSSYKPSPVSTLTKIRKFDIKGMNMPSTGEMDMPMHTINGKTYDIKRIDEKIKAGSTEIWEFDNSKGDEIHPMHLHGIQFQVIDRKGGRNKLIATETGFKDTVLLMPGEKVRTAITFPKNKGKFVVHCHNLEHENSGMMLNFFVN